MKRVPASARAQAPVLGPALAAAIAAAALLSAAGVRAVPPAWAVGAPLYEVNLQMFSRAGTYKELEKQLPRLKDQGVGILWLMPITARGVLKAFGSPYCVKDYQGFHAPYGSAQDFRDLVAAVHGQGLRLILDWVPNHTSWDNSLITEHPEFYRKTADGKIAQAYGWTDVAQLDYANPALRAWMIEAMAWWVQEYDVDGFRCDVAWGVPVDFWKEARAALDRVKPLYMLAENNNPAYQAAFDSDYDWNLMPVQAQTPLTDIATGARPASSLDAFIQKDLRDYAPDFMRMRFTSNHDEWKDFGTPSQRLRGGVRAFAVLAATLPGKPLLYNGQEIGWNPADRAAPIDWNDTSSFREFHRTLLLAHRDLAALHSGGFAKIRTDQDGRVYAFIRQKQEQRVLVILNLSDKETDVAIDSLELADVYEDIFTRGPVKWYGSMNLHLAPWEYRVHVAGPKPASLGPPGAMTLGVRPSRPHPILALDPSGRLVFHLPGHHVPSRDVPSRDVHGRDLPGHDALGRFPVPLRLPLP